jgi:pSer/pThr/pTyr-binding forkhead associated (FHA) protein
MTVRCSQGHENPDGSMFCDECGERLDQSAQVSAPAAVPVAPPPAPTPAPVAAPVAPATVTPIKLVVEADSYVFDLTGKSEITIGREDAVSNIYPDVDLTSHGGEEGGVSRLHAKIYNQGAQYMIEDQNSTNFTFVNKQKLAPKTPTPIKEGDEIRLGRVALLFKTA